MARTASISKSRRLLSVPLLWAELILAFLVILGGAFVRATGSGAGCGEHWPLCNGEAVPINPKLETIIEFSHRLSSGLSLLLFVALFISAMRSLPQWHACRAWAKLVLVSFLLEAAIGALLVLKKLVTTDTSVLRAAVIALHLVNTYLLLGGIVGMIWTLSRQTSALASAFDRPLAFIKRWRWLLLGWCLVGAAGAISALGDTLFPAQGLMHGLGQDLASDSHFLIRLRAFHPILALAVTLFTFVETLSRPGLAAGRWVQGLILFQVSFGVANLLLLAPLWMQLGHLLIADITWAAVVWYLLAALHGERRSGDVRVEKGLPVEYAH